MSNSASIEKVVSFATAYVDSKSPFGEYSLAQKGWVNEPIEKHHKFLNLVAEGFGSISILTVIPQLNIWLYNDSLKRESRLVELEAPSVIIDNQRLISEKILNGSNDAHIVILMLMASVNFYNEFGNIEHK